MATTAINPNGNVIYVEPNYESSITYRTSDDRITGHNVFTNNLEDYCIAVDLVVEIPSRNNGASTSQGNDVIQLSWKNGDSTTLSFFHGTDGYLTTAPYEVTTFKDINTTSNKDENGNFTINSYVNGENFGISSIDISFDSFQTPQVTIQFVDIRGISLFGAEQLAHNSVEGSMRSVSDNSTAGSFFKCFFTLPFPKFTLYVKGFYGEQVSYVLNCADFKASFDCTTGNFNATAQMIGYAYSLLGNITMSSLLVAPYDESFGMAYWQQNVENNNYTVMDRNGNPVKMPTLRGVIARLTQVKDKLADVEKEGAEKAQAAEEEGSNVQEVSTLINNTLREMQTHDGITVMEGPVPTTILPGLEMYGVKVEDYGLGDVVKEGDNLHKLVKLIGNNVESINDIIEKLNDSTIAKVKGSNSDGVTNVRELTSLDNLLDSLGQEKGGKLEREIANGLKKYGDKVRLRESSSASEKGAGNFYWKFVWFYYGDIIDRLKEKGSKVEEKLDEAAAETNEKKEEAIADSLGFEPTVKNMCKIIFASLDTFIHCVDETARQANAITARTRSTLGLDKCDLNTGDENGQVPAFPRVVRLKYKKENNTSTYEDSWIGDAISDNSLVPEANLVDGLLKGVQMVKDYVQKYESGTVIEEKDELARVVSTVGGSNATSTADLLDSSQWFGSCDTDNFGEMAYLITLRAFSTIGMNPSFFDAEKAKTAGKIDGEYFAKQLGNVSDEFINTINNGNVYTSESLIGAITDKVHSNLQKNGVWPWNKDGKHSYLVNEQNGKYLLNDSFRKARPDAETNERYYSYIVPCSSINGNGEKSDINVLSSYNGIKKYSSKYALIIEKNYTKFNDKYNSLEEDSKKLFGYMGFNLNSWAPTDANLWCNKKNTQQIGYNEFSTGYFPMPNEELNNKYTSFSFKQNVTKTNGNETQYNNGNVFTKNPGGAVKLYEGTCLKNRDELTVYLECDLSNITRSYPFTNLVYWGLGSDDVKAYVLLDSLSKGCQELTSFLTSDNKSNGLGRYVRYTSILQLGAGLSSKVEDCGGDSGLEGKIGEIHKLRTTVRKDVLESIIQEYTSWKEQKLNSLLQCLEVRGKNGQLWDKEKFNKVINAIQTNKNWGEILKGSGYDTVETYCKENLSEDFLSTYCKFTYSDTKLKLILRNGSYAQDELVRLKTQPCFIALTSEYTSVNGKAIIVNGKVHSGHTPYITTNTLKTYFESFLSAVKNSELKTSDTEIKIIDDFGDKTEKEIRIAYYQYCKSLYDKWLSNSTAGIYSIEDYFKVTGNANDRNFFNKNVVYIDTFYNKIDDELKINLVKFVDALVVSAKQDGYSLMSFLSTMCGDNRMSIQTVQNFVDLSGGDDASESRIRRMFTPIPYNSLDWVNGINQFPTFIFLYVYEESKTPNVGDGTYNRDSFDLRFEQTTPKAISSKDITMGYRIPAFGVTYATQNQSYFTNIDINMDNPITTEAALRAQYNIAEEAVGKDGNGGANKGNVIALGQDLFTVHSNNSYTCTVTMMGCAYVQPLMYFQLNNIPMFDGAYIIYKVNHSISQGYMKTTFQGSRVSEIQSPKLGKAFRTKKNSNDVSVGIEDIESEQGRQASLDNNCPYKRFSPDTYGEGLGPKVETNIKVKDIKDTKGNHYVIKSSKGANADGSVTSRNYEHNPESTILDLLCMTASEEAAAAQNGGLDEIMVKLVATTLYNLYFYWHKKWDFLDGNRTACYAGGIQTLESYLNTRKKVKYDPNLLRKWVREVFESSPSVLVGKTTTVNYPVPIRENGKSTSKKTSSKTIALEDVQRMMFYMCPRYYIQNNETVYEVGGEYSDKYFREVGGHTWWRDSVYCCQHDSNNGINCGMIFAGESKLQWEAKEVVKDKKADANKNPSDKATGLYNAIKATCDFSDQISISNMKMEPNSRNKDSFYITCTPSSGLAQVFDAVIQAYYDDITTLKWCVENDTSSYPYKIYIECGKTPKKKIGVAQKQSDGQHKFCNFDENYKGGNEFFYRSVRKKFGDINASNLADFQSKYMNFTHKAKGSDGTNDNTETAKRINAVTNYTVQSCTVGGGTAVVSEGVGSEYVPSKMIDNWDAGKAATWIVNHSYGNSNCKPNPQLSICAFTVQQAIIAGGVSFSDSYEKGGGWKFAVGLLKKGHWVLLGSGSTASEQYKQIKPSLGDIMGMTHGSNASDYGHICLYCGEEYGWVSDFKQCRAYVYNKSGPGTYYWIRYKGGAPTTNEKPSYCYNGKCLRK